MQRKNQIHFYGYKFTSSTNSGPAAGSDFISTADIGSQIIRAAYCRIGSEESEGVEGLHLLDGEILRIPEQEGLKIPNIGWNSLDLQNNGRLFQNLEGSPFVYFVHSYYLKAREEAIVKATIDYSTHIHASVEKDNIFACQFHPEKSGTVGLQILSNFAQL